MELEALCILNYSASSPLWQLHPFYENPSAEDDKVDHESSLGE
jgi:hypothetical protein